MRIAVIQRNIREGLAMPDVPDADVVFTRDTLEPPQAAALGTVVVLEGDACMDPDTIADVSRLAPAALVLQPASESELQAEAALELALTLSESVAGLVIVVDDDGGEPGEQAHGGSAIVYAGEVLAEALAGSDVLTADVEVPIARPLAHDTPVAVPTMLLQRLAHHQGRHLPVDYPADV